LTTVANFAPSMQALGGFYADTKRPGRHFAMENRATKKRPLSRSAQLCP